MELSTIIPRPIAMPLNVMMFKLRSNILKKIMAMNPERRIPIATFDALLKLGHKVGNWGFWSYLAGDGTISYRDPDTGYIMAAADPRREMYALGY